MANYEIQAGTLLETFETIGDWTAGGTAGGSIAVDTSISTVGAGSLKITAPAGGNYYATKTINLDMSRAGIISLDVYVANFSNYPSINLYFSSVSNFAKTFSKQINNCLKPGWNRIRFYKNLWGNTGIEDWANTMIRMRVRVDSNADTAGVVYFDQVRYGTYHRPKVIWTCDDGWATVYSELFPYMKARGMKATCFVPHSNIGRTASYMTLANLTELYEAGWDICSHTYNHTDLRTLATQAEIQTEISTMRTYLKDNGFVRNGMYDFFCYPDGGINETIIDAVTAEGVKAARTVRLQAGVSVATPPDNSILLITSNLGSANTLDAAKAYVTSAIASGCTLVIESHTFVETATEDTQWPITDTQSLIDFLYPLIQGGVIDNPTLSEWYKGLSEPRRIV